MSSFNRSIVGRLILAAVTTIASIVFVDLLVGWTVEYFAPEYPYDTMLTVVSLSVLPFTFGVPCAFIIRKDKVVGAISLFFAILFCFAAGASSVLADDHATAPGSGACGLILGSALALLTVFGTIVGYIIAPIGKIMDDRSSER